MTQPILLMVLPELGGLGKSTFSEFLLAALEANGRQPLALDGDPSARGLIARRAGAPTTGIKWPDNHESRAALILGGVEKAGVGVLDFGAGSSQTFSVPPTVDDICGQTRVRVVIMAIGESSKIGNAQAISRLRKEYPHIEMVFVKNAKSGANWSSFERTVEGLPVLEFRAIATPITAWMNNYLVQTNEKGVLVRPALIRTAMFPADGYTRIASHLRWLINQLTRQQWMQDTFNLPPLPDARALATNYTLRQGEMVDERLSQFETSCALYEHIRSGADPEGDTSALIALGQKVVELRASLRKW